MMTWASVTGIVIRSSIVPVRFSSASKPIVRAGNAKTRIRPSQRNISRALARPKRKKVFQKKKPNVSMTMQMTM